MNEDRKLLEWAAKAAGVDLAWDVPPTPYYVKEGVGLRDWNPLNDDGDALRLAVALGMFNEGMPNAVKLQWELSQASDLDPYSDTRRAIVRAAVAIGQSLAVKEAG
jgi:hypothetical protein